MDSVKATIEWDKKRITFEGPADFVQAQVKAFAATQSKSLEKEKLAEQPKPVSIADLIQEKRPKGHHEVVAVLAFYLAEEGKLEFSEDDIRRAYLQARVRPPKVIGQALRDAKNKYDYILLGESRGVYRLSPHGDRTVRYDLPRLPA